jgi:MoxR-like ATPase
MEMNNMTKEFAQFKGTSDYIAATDLKNSVNIAINLGRPLIIKGEPGTGKTMLAKSIAEDLGLELIIWSIKSTTKAKEGLYSYDTVQRLYDSQFGDCDVSNISNYINLGRLGEAFTANEQTVLLIDEIDKADLEFPNDLLWELDIMNFYIPETKETITAKIRPIVIITSNAEKDLPEAFLRRCIFHYIDFPDRKMMNEIIKVHHPDLEDILVNKALEAFYGLRQINGIQKKPSTSELLDWIQALVLGGIKPHQIVHELPFLGALIKKNEDIDKVKRYLDIQEGRKPKPATY